MCYLLCIIFYKHLCKHFKVYHYWLNTTIFAYWCLHRPDYWLDLSWLPPPQCFLTLVHICCSSQLHVMKLTHVHQEVNLVKLSTLKNCLFFNTSCLLYLQMQYVKLQPTQYTTLSLWWIHGTWVSIILLLASFLTHCQVLYCEYISPS